MRVGTSEKSLFRTITEQCCTAEPFFQRNELMLHVHGRWLQHFNCCLKHNVIEVEEMKWKFDFRASTKRSIAISKKYSESGSEPKSYNSFISVHRDIFVVYCDLCVKSTASNNCCIFNQWRPLFGALHRTFITTNKKAAMHRSTSVCLYPDDVISGYIFQLTTSRCHFRIFSSLLLLNVKIANKHDCS